LPWHVRTYRLVSGRSSVRSGNAVGGGGDRYRERLVLVGRRSVRVLVVVAAVSAVLTNCVTAAVPEWVDENPLLSRGDTET
jgi:hypothetical protein